MAEKAIRVQGIKCSACGEVLVSMWGHDYHPCACGASAVDGGRNYLRYTWNPEQASKPEVVEVMLKPNGTFVMAPKKRAKAA